MEDFFAHPNDRSAVKTTLVVQYFEAWANVMKNTVCKSNWHGRRNIAYIDLFCGPGKYEDGTPATPVLILRHVVHDDVLRNIVLSVFNDKNGDSIDELKKEVAGIEESNPLVNRPIYYKTEVSDKFKVIVRKVNAPSLIFLDPFGYKGISLELLSSLLRGWGNDGIFFFNYRRINSALGTDIFDRHLMSIFGKEDLNNLRVIIQGMDPEQREEAVMDALEQSLKKNCGKFVLRFRFPDKHGNRTSHYLMFVSKDSKGFNIMKSIMAKQSADKSESVPEFEYQAPQLSLFEEPGKTVDDLEEILLERFAGMIITVIDICNSEFIEQPFLKKHCKEALENLRDKGLVTIEAPARGRNISVLRDNAVVTFQKQD